MRTSPTAPIVTCATVRTGGSAGATASRAPPRAGGEGDVDGAGAATGWAARSAGPRAPVAQAARERARTTVTDGADGNTRTRAPSFTGIIRAGLKKRPSRRISGRDFQVLIMHPFARGAAFVDR